MNYRILVAMFVLLTNVDALAEDDLAPILHKDPHRNELGFFDMHICNWADRPLFFKSLFSTTKFNDIEVMTVYSPDGEKVTELDMSKFIHLKRKGKPEKKVFLTDSDLPADSKAGWYTIKVKTKDGKEYSAKDYVVMNRLSRASVLSPADEAEDIEIPKELKWKPVPGATHYKVFMRDGYETTQILNSKLLKEPRIKLKPGLLKPGGYYLWKVHARDVNENIILGDFNSGSVNKWMEFTVADVE